MGVLAMKKSELQGYHSSRSLTKISALLFILLGFFVLLPGSASALVVSTYSITDLGTLPGHLSSYAMGINNSGQIVGWTETVDGGVIVNRAFLYTGGVMTELGTLGGPYSRAFAINNAGQVAGDAAVVPGSPSNCHAFRYTGGVMTDLGALPGADASYGKAINTNGEVVGMALTPASSGFWPYHAFRYSGGGPMVDLGTVSTPGFDQSEAYGINDAGVVVGKTTPPGGGNGHAFIYAAGVMTDIGASWDAYGYYSRASGINNAGKVIGTANPKSGGGSYAFQYLDGQVWFLGTLGGNNSVANGLNSLGEVVGSSTTIYGFGHPFLYTQGRMFDLTELVVGQNPFAQLQVATAINDGGTIVGYGTLPDGSVRAFRANPGPGKKTFGYVPYDLLL